MKARDENISNYFGTVLFIVLFLFITAAFSGQSIQQPIKPVLQELASELNARSVQAILDQNGVQMPVSQRDQVTVIDKLNLHFSNPAFKQNSVNRMFAQRFRTLQQAELVITPFILVRFLDHLFPHVADDMLVLS